eukprot:4792263-Prymnesium_polylepis.1
MLWTSTSPTPVGVTVHHRLVVTSIQEYGGWAMTRFPGNDLLSRTLRYVLRCCVATARVV